MLIWFRNERVRTVTWGGNPFQKVSTSDDPLELSPRRSFAQWHQVVEGTSDPWTVPDLTAAQLIGASVTDVIVQFRSVRILIAQDQLEQVLRQVRSSDQHVVVANADGQILEANPAFAAVLGSGNRPVRALDDLPYYFTDPGEIQRRLQLLKQSRQPWRGEVELENARGERKPLLVRADPVMSSPERVLGYVLLFMDLTERKAADAARRRFQEGILQSHRKPKGPLLSQSVRSRNRWRCPGCCPPSSKTLSWRPLKSPTGSIQPACPACWKASAPLSRARRRCLSIYLWGQARLMAPMATRHEGRK